MPIESRKYAKLADLKTGDTVQVDSGFTCIPDNARRKVYNDRYGNLCIRCGGPFETEETKNAPQVHDHTLDGQLGKNGHLIGVFKI